MDFSISNLEQDYDLYHSTFQINNFITTKDNFNLYGCYKQSLRETMKRVGIYRDALCNDKILDIDIRKIERSISLCNNDLDRETLEVELIRKKLKVSESQKNLSEIERELSQFYKQACILKSRLEKIHGSLTKEKREMLEQGFWEDKYKYQLALDMSMYGKPGESMSLFQNFNTKIQNKLNLECPPDKAIQLFQQRSIIEIDQDEISKINVCLDEIKSLTTSEKK